MLRSLFVLLIAQTSLYAQLYPFKKNETWGLIDKEGKVVVEPVYSYISDFKSGLAIAKKEDKTGVLGDNGLPVLPFEYEQAKIFPNLIAAWKNGYCQLFDKQGHIISKNLYSKVSFWTKDKILTHCNDKKGIFSLSGVELLACQYDWIGEIEKSAPFHKISKDGKIGLWRADGKIAVEASYSQIWIETGMSIAQQGKSYDVFEFDEKFEIKNKTSYINKAALDIALKAKKDKEIKTALKQTPTPYRWISEGFKFKLIDKQAQNVLNLDFYDVSIDSKTQKSLARRVGEDKKDICYYIDNLSGKIIFEAKVKDILISDFEFGGYAKASVDTLWDAFISNKGELISQLENKKIKNIGLYSEKGICAVEFADGSIAFVNHKTQVLEKGFQVAGDFVNGYAIAKKDGKFGAYPDIPFVYDGINPCEQGLFRVKKGKGKEGKWGIINTKNTVILPFEYDMIYPFEQNHACVRKNGKSGLIDRSGKLVIAVVHDVEYIGDLRNSLAQTAFGKTERGFSKYGYINAKGETVVECQYQKIEGFEEIYAKKSGIAKIYKDNKMGYINHLGTVFIEPVYDKIEDLEKVYRQSKAIAKAIKNGKTGYFDNLGRLAIPCIYDEIQNFEVILEDSSNLFKVKLENKYGYIDAKGKIRIPILYQELSEPKNGYICAKKDNLCGVLSDRAEVVLPFLYVYTGFIQDSDLILVSTENKRVVYFNQNGEPVSQINKPIVVLPQTDKLKFISFNTEIGLGVAKKDNLYALADVKGKLLTKYEYLQIGEFSEGFAYFQDKSKKYGYFDKNGQIVLAAQYHKATNFKQGLAAVALAPNKWTYIKTDGKEAFKGFFRQAEPFFGGYALTNASEIINLQGSKMGVLTVESDAKFFSDRAVAKDAKGYFHIAPNGLEAYPQRFDEVTPFFGETAFAKRGEIWELTRYTAKWGEKDPSNVRESKIRFSKAEKEFYLKENGENRKIETQFQVTQDIGWTKVSEGLWRMIDTDGNLVSDAVFNQVEILGNGAKVESKYAFGLFYDGKVMLEPIYDSIRLKNGLLRVENKGNMGYFSIAGRWVLPLN